VNMDMAHSNAHAAIAVRLEDRMTMTRSLVRWVALGALGVVALLIALSQSITAGAAAPVAYDTPNCIPINYTTCAPTANIFPNTNINTNTGTGFVGNTVVSTYIDPRYCGGVVSIVTDSGGNLINVCPNGQRVFPVFPDFGFGAGFVSPSFVNGNFNNNGGFINNGGFVSPSFVNGNFFNNNGGFINSNGNFFNGNGFNSNGFNGNGFNTFPAGGTVVGGTVFYNDNRFCGDGKLAFVPGRGYFCQNGAPLFRNGATTVNCDNFFVNGCGVFRPFEVASTPATQTAPVTAAPAAAPVAPAAVSATVEQAPVAVIAAPAAPAQTATALNAPTTQAPAAAPASTSGVKILSTTPATTPTVNQQDDHRG